MRACSVLPSSSSPAIVCGDGERLFVVGTASECSATLAGAQQDRCVVDSPEPVILWANTLDPSADHIASEDETIAGGIRMSQQVKKVLFLSLS